ncbi:2-desacetyl-2-hydroxyethyl bacteriochlorophyllide A dehydrogenase [Paenibacillus rhizosphaerae]|uniref:2-desacetyl-2-hydroxyethyl bacteriochlorophyllide A dehydrogenase n=1 Tax=Paenibacillus rhizosphaerae TaxID=297318 RepID=A0A839TJ87_9BACL|nr:alcohol dehydrogenase catalytic domain-containing protein [Paenibacillus rhizosphaerae]MBB3125409.1 2-desacetyl-2-hydroxyethyl bacteriochlorophyllide A dehydrogenase [Paenibacillus rhizosphaerae]
MKAAVLNEWEHIEIKNVAVPELCDEEVLIKVTYAGVCGSDVTIYKGKHPTAKTPVILGHEFTGVVEKVNSSKRSDLKMGDRVVVEPLISCGECSACLEGNWHVCRSLKLLGIHTNGGFADYVKVPAAKVIKLKDSMSDRIAALTEPFAVGFHVNQRGGTKAGDKVLIIGGGPIGMVIGIMAKRCGAERVVFTELNEARIDMIKSFGFEAIHPGHEDVAALSAEITQETGYDVVFEVSGSQSGLLSSTDLCAIRGTVVFVGFPHKRPEVDVLTAIFKELNLVGSRVYTFKDFVRTVRMLEEIVESQQYNLEGMISDTMPVEQAEEAIQKMIRGENLGKILLTY